MQKCKKNQFGEKYRSPANKFLLHTVEVIQINSDRYQSELLTSRG